MNKVKVRLRPLVTNINLPTVLKTAILPGDENESLFIATQGGKIFYLRNNNLIPFLDIQSQIITLGVENGGYDERGLLGLAFHPNFQNNGLFYLHYSVVGSQGPGALETKSGNLFSGFTPNPCKRETLNLRWSNRNTQYDHVDTVEEWIYLSSSKIYKRRTLLNLRRPFFNHNGVNSLNFSPETGNLVLTTGDGGSGYDPFNLSQNNLEIAGKIIEIDISKNETFSNPPIASRFDDLPEAIQKMLFVVAKGVRNILGITYYHKNQKYLKIVGNVGQDLVESIFVFNQYKLIPITKLANQDPIINFGWRAWEGDFPTTVINNCLKDPNLNYKMIAYYQEAITTNIKRLRPLICYFHQDERKSKFSGTALTGVQVYLGKKILQLSGAIIFSDYLNKNGNNGILGYTKLSNNYNFHNYEIIEVAGHLANENNLYVSLGTNQKQDKIFLGTFSSSDVTRNDGTVYEIVSNN